MDTFVPAAVKGIVDKNNIKKEYNLIFLKGVEYLFANNQLGGYGNTQVLHLLFNVMILNSIIINYKFLQSTVLALEAIIDYDIHFY